MRRWRSLPLKTRRTTTKNTGTKITASTVALIMPPITPVPMARWLAEPAPDDTTSGSTPRMKANEVIRIGRKRRWHAASVASTRLLPCACRSFANSMIRIAFLADSPITAIRPTLKNTSLGRPRSVAPSNAPSTPSGTTSITDAGIDQLSYSAARHRNTANNEKASRITACAPASFSSRDRPVHS